VASRLPKPALAHEVRIRREVFRRQLVELPGWNGLLRPPRCTPGVVSPAAAGRLLADQLFEVGATDPATYLAAPLRATRVDPLAALRAE